MPDEPEVEIPVTDVPPDEPADDDPPLEPVPEDGGTPEDGVPSAMDDPYPATGGVSRAEWFRQDAARVEAERSETDGEAETPAGSEPQP